MVKFKNILLEDLNKVYQCEILIKTNPKFNKVNILDEIRGLKWVVVVKVVQNQYLDSQANNNQEYSLLKLKYISHNKPEDDIKVIAKDALISTKIIGLLQFIPRVKTIKKIGGPR